MNIVLTNDLFLPQLTLKLIDFGCGMFTHEYIEGCTFIYFPPNKIKFKTKEERILAEYYMLSRVIQEVCMESIFAYENVYLKKLKNNWKFRRLLLNNNVENIMENLKRMELYYCKEIIEVLNMIMINKKSVKEIKEYVNLYLTKK